MQNYTASTNFVQCFTFGDSIDVTLHIEDNEISVGEDKDNLNIDKGTNLGSEVPVPNLMSAYVHRPGEKIRFLRNSLPCRLRSIT